MAMITRTVMSSLEHSAYVSVDSQPVVPECITRFSPGTRVEVRALKGGGYAVQALPGDPLRVFGEENWRTLV